MRFHLPYEETASSEAPATFRRNRHRHPEPQRQGVQKSQLLHAKLRSIKSKFWSVHNMRAKVQ